MEVRLAKFRGLFETATCLGYHKKFGGYKGFYGGSKGKKYKGGKQAGKYFGDDYGKKGYDEHGKHHDAHKGSKGHYGQSGKFGKKAHFKKGGGKKKGYGGHHGGYGHDHGHGGYGKKHGGYGKGHGHGGYGSHSYKSSRQQNAPEVRQEKRPHAVEEEDSFAPFIFDDVFDGFFDEKREQKKDLRQDERPYHPFSGFYAD